MKESTIKRLVIAGMLTFGTCTVVAQKIIFNLKSTGKNGEQKLFSKPYYQTEVMFLGMAGCLIVYGVYSLIQYVTSRYFDNGMNFEKLTSKPAEAVPVRVRVTCSAWPSLQSATCSQQPYRTSALCGSARLCGRCCVAPLLSLVRFFQRSF